MAGDSKLDTNCPLDVNHPERFMQQEWREDTIDAVVPERKCRVGWGNKWQHGHSTVALSES